VTVVIRADASPLIGTGHVMRCLALAQAWQANGELIIFLMANKAPVLAERLNCEGFQVVYVPYSIGSAEDAQGAIDLARQSNAGWIVIDGYQFGAEYQCKIKEAGFRLLCLDDYGHAERYDADIVLNQNISAHPNLYRNRKPYTQLLLGTPYALLRQEFWQWRGWNREVSAIATKILVTLGGADPDNVTLTVIQALQKIDLLGIEAIVVIGGSNPYGDLLEQTVRTTQIPIQLLKNVQNMPELMAWAEIAILQGEVPAGNWRLWGCRA
jgi:UDP-2,4-diacetamido-2,4,6-trideoxy-beta-L-altropyranose hydrolase